MNGYLTMRRCHLALATLAVLAALGWSATAAAQPAGGQIVDSLDAHRTRIQSLLDERLSGLIASGNYVLRVDVQGEPARVARPGRPGTGVLELPGFRRTPEETAEGADGFRVTQVGVRILINEELPESDLSYIRSMVPIVADFDPARGDTLDIQVISEEALAEAEQAAQARRQQPPAGLEEALGGFGLRDWVLIGLMALALLLLLILLARMRRGARQPEQPMPMAAPPPAPEPAREAELSAAERKRLQEQEEERELIAVRKDVVKSMVSRPDIARQLVSSWQSQPKNLSGLIQAFGPTVARQAIAPHMSPEGYQNLESALRSEKPQERSALTGILREASLYLTTQELAQPEEIRPDPFAFLTELSRGQIAHLIKDEPVRVKAIVLSRISAEHTAHILESLPREMQLEVAVQIGNFQSLPLDAVADIARNLAEKARALPDEKTVDIEGPRTLVDLMTASSGETIRYLLDAMKSKDRKLSEQVERRFFLFDAIPLVPDDMVPQVVRRLPSDTVIQALQGADPAVQRKVIMGFPEQARTGLVTTLRAAQYDPQTVMDARQQLVRKFQELGADGRLDLKQISDAWQSQAKAS